MSKFIVVFALWGSLSVQHLYALTLNESLALARAHSPELAAARAEREALAAEAPGAGAWANPGLGAEVEGVGGGQEEYTLTIVQEIPLTRRLRHGRRAAQQAVVAADLAVIEAQRALDLAVHRAFIETFAGQEIQEIRAEQAALGREAVATARNRHQAGAASEWDGVQAEMALEEIELEHANAQAELENARKALGRLIGRPPSEWKVLEGDYWQPLEPDSGAAHRGDPPALQRWDALVRQAEAEAAAAKSGGVPDLALGAGVRHAKADGENTMLFSVSMPLPLFARAGPASRSASWRVEALRAEAEAAKRALETERDEARSALDLAEAAARRHQDRLLPLAERALTLCQEGYETGQRSWMELIQARQAQGEAAIQSVLTRRAAHLARATYQQLHFEE